MLPTGVRKEIKNFLHYWLHPLLFRQPNNQFAAPIPSYRKIYFNHTEKDVSNITNAIIHIFLLTLSASSNLSSIFFPPFSERWIQCGYDNITYDKKNQLFTYKSRSKFRHNLELVISKISLPLWVRASRGAKSLADKDRQGLHHHCMSLTNYYILKCLYP